MTVVSPSRLNIKEIKGRTIVVRVLREYITVYLNVNETKQITQESFMREKIYRQQTAAQF